MSDYNMSSQGGFSTENNGASQQGSSGFRQSVTPVTIKQINDATQPSPDGEFVVNHVTLNTVSVVGIVRKIVPFTNTILITVEDGTGSITVKKWVVEEKTTVAEETEKYEAHLNKYVMVGGSLKIFQDKKSIQNVSILPIEDHNQVLYHNLSAISNHLHAHGVVPSKKTEDSLFVSDKSESGGISGKILNFIKKHSESMPEGVPSSYIAQVLNLAPDMVQQTCNDICESGLAYMGSDESSYLAS